MYECVKLKNFVCCREFQVLFKDVSGMKQFHVICSISVRSQSYSNVYYTDIDCCWGQWCNMICHRFTTQCTWQKIT